MHLKRVVVALILLPLFYACVMLLPPEFFLFMIVFLSTVALAEFYALSKVNGVLRYASLFLGVSLLIVYAYRTDLFLGTLLFSVLSVMALRLFLKRDPSHSLTQVAAAVLGLLYIPCMLTFQLRLVKNGPAWVLLLYASVWVADSAAYYVGKGIGKRRLYAEISPNKTVAGAFGSLFGGVLGAILIRAGFLTVLSPVQAVSVGAAIGLTTIIGDLVESMIKRDAGVKDSGSLLPGHGGILDKLDGVMFAGPVFYWICAGMGLVR